MKYLLLAILIYALPAFSCKDISSLQPLQQDGIYILHSSGIKVLKQCARESFVATAVWTPTVKQIQIIDKRLKTHLIDNNLALPIGPESKFHRQYFGFEQSGEKFVYVNVYPTSAQKKGLEGTTPVVSCSENSDFWGATFSIDTMQFESIETN